MRNKKQKKYKTPDASEINATIWKVFLERSHDHLEGLLHSVFHLTRALPSLGSERNRATKNLCW